MTMTIRGDVTYTFSEVLTLQYDIIQLLLLSTIIIIVLHWPSGGSIISIDWYYHSIIVDHMWYLMTIIIQLCIQPAYYSTGYYSMTFQIGQYWWRSWYYSNDDQASEDVFRRTVMTAVMIFYYSMTVLMILKWRTDDVIVYSVFLMYCGDYY